MGEWQLTQVSDLKMADVSEEQYGQSLNITTITVTQIMGMMTEMDAQSQTQFGQLTALVNSLLLSKVQTLRTAHIILGSIGIASALMMILRIIREARETYALRVTLRPRKLDFLKDVHVAEVFPFALAFAIVVQQAVFVGVQSSALQSVVVTGCSKVAQVVFPAVFLLGYTTFVHGLETAIRSLGSRPFRARGKWANSICAVSVAILLLFTWIPTAVWRSPNRCFGNLLWFPVRYNIIAISIISVLLFFLLIMGAIIMIQLKRSVLIDENERMAASMMCYYISLTALVYTLVLPFFVQALLHKFDSGLSSSRLAEIALFGNSVMLVVFHLFLRVNATRLTIKALGAPNPQKRRRIRFFGPSDMAMTISGPFQSPALDRDETALLSEKKAYLEPDYYSRPEKSSLADRGLSSPNRLDPSTWPLPPNPFSPTIPSSSTSTKRAKSSYSIFPTRADEIPRLPPTVYSPDKDSATEAFIPLKRTTTASEVPSITDVSASYDDSLRPPLPLFANRHRRDSSGESSATVQIGLRLSVAPAAIVAGHVTTQNRTQPVRGPTVTLPAHPAVLRRDQSDSSGESLGLPIRRPMDVDLNGSSSSLVQADRNTEPSATAGSDITPTENSGEYLQKARDKVLPPIPSRKPGASGLRMNPVSPMPTINSAPSVKSPPANATTAAGWI